MNEPESLIKQQNGQNTSSVYVRAGCAAYGVLSAMDRIILPVDLRQLIYWLLGISVVSYASFAVKSGVTRAELSANVPSEYGFIIKKGGNTVILYNEKKSPTTTRFTLAHELGHTILGHLRDDPVSDREANCFARNFLCPVPIARYLKLKTPADFAKAFSISDKMAEVAAAMHETDYRNMPPKLYKKILTAYTGLTPEKALRHIAHIDGDDEE